MAAQTTTLWSCGSDFGMIEAEFNALKAEGYHSSLLIIERLLQMHLNDISMVGTQAALLAGFAISFLGQDVAKGTMEASVSLDMTFIGLVATTFGLMMFVVITSTLLYSMAPNLALRGTSGGAMRISVSKLESDLRFIKKMFAAGCTTFGAMVLFIVWNDAHWQSAALATACLSTCCLTTICYVGRLYQRYKPPEAKPVAGRGVQKDGMLRGAEYLTALETVNPSNPIRGRSKAAGNQHGNQGVAMTGVSTVSTHM